MKSNVAESCSLTQIFLLEQHYGAPSVAKGQQLGHFLPLNKNLKDQEYDPFLDFFYFT